MLRELHDEFKSYPTDVMIDFMKGDVRLDSKTKKSIKEKLFELQLIKLGRGDRTGYFLMSHICSALAWI